MKFIRKQRNFLFFLFFYQICVTGLSADELTFINHTNKPVYAVWVDIKKPLQEEGDFYTATINKKTYSLNSLEKTVINVPDIEAQETQQLFISHSKNLIEVEYLPTFRSFKDLEKNGFYVSDNLSQRNLLSGIISQKDFHIDEFEGKLRTTLAKTIYITNKTDKTIFVAPYSAIDNTSIRRMNPLEIKAHSNGMTFFSPHLKEGGLARKLDKEKFIFCSLSNDNLKETFIDGNDRQKSIACMSKIQDNSMLDLMQSSYQIAVDKDGLKCELIPLSTRLFGTKYDFNQELKGQKELLEKGLLAYPSKGNKYQVRTGTMVSDEESDYIEKRIHSESSKKGCEKLLSRNLEQNEKVPTIALVFTGGGFRAMISSIGFLRGAKDNGLLDCSAYMTGLSGSTWAIIPWVASGKSIEEYDTILKTKIDSLAQDSTLKKIPAIGTLLATAKTFSTNLINDRNDLTKYQMMRLQEIFYGQYHGLVGWWGALITNVLFDKIISENKHLYTLSRLKTNLQKQAYPFPICVALDAAVDTGWQEGIQEEKRQLGQQFKESNIWNPDRMTWYEFNPYEIGTFQNGGSWVKTECFGNIFYNGETVSTGPEYPISHFVGIWGSAFALNRKEINAATQGKFTTFSEKISDFFNKQGIVGSLIEGVGSKFIDVAWKPNERITAGLIANPTYGMSMIKNEDNLDQFRENLILIDGGHLLLKKGDKLVRHNFASVPVLWRDIDIIVFCDSEQQGGKIEHLEATEKMAEQLGIPFPKLNTSVVNKLKNQPVTLLESDNPKAPLVVYMQNKKNTDYDKIIHSPYNPSEKIYTSTANFIYTKNEYQEYSGLSELIMKQAKDTLKIAIEKILVKKSNQKNLLNKKMLKLIQNIKNKVDNKTASKAEMNFFEKLDLFSKNKDIQQKDRKDLVSLFENISLSGDESNELMKEVHQEFLNRGEQSHSQKKSKIDLQKKLNQVIDAIQEINAMVEKM